MRFTVVDVIWVVVSHVVAKDFAENANRMLFCEGEESKENGTIKNASSISLSIYLSTYLPTNLRMMIIILLVG